MQPDIFQSMNIMKDACKSRGSTLGTTVTPAPPLFLNFGETRMHVVQLHKLL